MGLARVRRMGPKATEDVVANKPVVSPEVAAVHQEGEAALKGDTPRKEHRPSLGPCTAMYRPHPAWTTSVVGGADVDVVAEDAVDTIGAHE